MPSSSTSRLAAALLVLASLAVTLVVVELALAKFFPFPDPFARAKLGEEPQRYVPWAHAPNLSMQFTAEPGLPGVTGTSTFTTNALGMRGPAIAIPKERDEYRVFLVGGSTMECMIVDDAQSPERLLQGLLAERAPGRKVRVYNAGRSGDRTFDHVALVGQRLAQLQPDLIVVLAGANDQRAAILNVDYLHMPRGRREHYGLAALLKHVATEFQLPRLAYAALHRTALTERERLEQVARTTDYREKVALKAGKPVSEKPPRTDLPAYGRNLATLAGIVKAQGAQVLFVTHPSTWNSPVDPKARQWHWMDHVDGTVYREDLMDRALEQYNDETRRVAAAQGVALLDAARRIPKSREYFYDDMHFNAKGAALLATLMAQALVEQKLLPAQP